MHQDVTQHPSILIVNQQNNFLSGKLRKFAENLGKCDPAQQHVVKIMLLRNEETENHVSVRPITNTALLNTQLTLSSAINDMLCIDVSAFFNFVSPMDSKLPIFKSFALSGFT